MTFSLLFGPAGPTLGFPNTTQSGTAPTITTSGLASGTVGVSYSQTLVATGSTPITWSITSGSISPLSLNASTGAITGTPATATTLTATFRATNAFGNNSRSLSITVNASSTAPLVTTTSLASGTVGSFYSQTLTATGTTPITWTLQSGTLPAGLSLSSSGVLSGTPTTAATTSGLVFRATNAVGSADSGSLSITISAAIGAPVLVTAPTITVWRAA
jgi:hypothetical protein